MFREYINIRMLVGKLNNQFGQDKYDKKVPVS